MGKRSKKNKRREKYLLKDKNKKEVKEKEIKESKIKEKKIRSIKEKVKEEKEKRKKKNEEEEEKKDKKTPKKKQIKIQNQITEPKTIFDYINNIENLTSLPSKEEEEMNILTKKNNSSNSSKITNKELKEIKNQISNSNTINNEDYLKSLKPKIVIINGKMTIEKPDISLLNKQYNEENYKNNIQIQQLDQIKKVTSLSFKKIQPRKKWSENETKLFYKAIEIFGLDFSFLEIILKPRTRLEIKKKYHKEIKINNLIYKIKTIITLIK